jgi:hypothetical protein
MARCPLGMNYCPNCLSAFTKPLTRKTRCKICGQDIYVRSLPNRAGRVAVTREELEKIKSEWIAYDNACQQSLLNRPLRTEEEYQRLFDMPVTLTKPAGVRQGATSNLKPVPVRWALGSWCREHCRRIAGYPSCHDLQGIYMGGIDTLPTLPAAEVACTSEEFHDWWSDHHSGEDICLPCDCHIELSFDGGQSFHNLTK